VKAAVLTAVPQGAIRIGDDTGAVAGALMPNDVLIRGFGASQLGLEQL
jgi:hypothetical protein